MENKLNHIKTPDQPIHISSLKSDLRSPSPSPAALRAANELSIGRGLTPRRLILLVSASSPNGFLAAAGPPAGGSGDLLRGLPRVSSSCAWSAAAAGFPLGAAPPGVSGRFIWYASPSGPCWP